jgi:hypothetical protein
MAAQWYTCTVDQAGPASDGIETPPPVIYLMLSDTAGTFTGQWFFAAANSTDQMLAVGLAAISLGLPVNAVLDQPDPSGEPYTQCYRIYLAAA